MTDGPEGPASVGPPPTHSRNAERVERFATAAHYLSLLVAFVVLCVLNRHSWFGTDDFDFLAARGLHGALRSIWTPHNEHWSTVPILIWRALYSLVQLHTSFPYLVVNLLAHLGLAHVLWRAMRSMHVEPLVATSLVVLFEFLGSGGDDIVRPFQIGFTGAVLMGWLAILLANRSQASRWRDRVGWVASIVCLLFSGVSVTMVVVAALVAFLRRGWRAALRTVLPAAAVFATWYALVGRHAYHFARSLGSTLKGVPAYVARGLATAIAHTFSVSAPLGVGALVVFLLGLWLALRLDLVHSEAAPAFAGVVGAVGFFVVNAFGRVQLGSSQATVSRYAYVAAALALPALGLALSAIVEPGETSAALARLRRGIGPAREGVEVEFDADPQRLFGSSNSPTRSWTGGHILRLVVVLCALALLIWTNTGTLLIVRDRFVAQSLAIKDQLVAAAHLARSEPTIPGSLPAGQLGVVDLTTHELVGFARAGALPGGVRPPATAVEAAVLATQYEISGAPDYETNAARVFQASPSSSSAPFSTPAPYPATRAEPRCNTVRASTAFVLVTLAVRSTTSIKLSSARPGVVFATVRDGLASPVLWITLVGGQAKWLDVAAPRSTLSIRLERGMVLRTC